MLIARLSRTAVAVAVAVIPLAPLYCPSDDPAAMACCASQANTCNQPTAPDDDCCRDAPTEGQTVCASGALRAGVPAPLALEAVTLAGVAATGGTWTPHRLWGIAPPSFSLHPPLVLRI